MRTILKFRLKETDTQKVEMPKGATILSVQNQNGALCLWAEVESNREPESRTIEVFGTGNPISMVDNRAFIDTVQMDGLVWHVYERTTDNSKK